VQVTEGLFTGAMLLVNNGDGKYDPNSYFGSVDCGEGAAVLAREHTFGLEYLVAPAVKAKSDWLYK
jgi:hypothetical protein